jgi:hypothetical protein
VVLGTYSETLVGRIEARTARDGPALQNAIEFEPQVVMKAPGGVLLNDVELPSGPLHAAPRFRRCVKVPLRLIGLQ